MYVLHHLEKIEWERDVQIRRINELIQSIFKELFIVVVDKYWFIVQILFTKGQKLLLANIEKFL